MSERIQKVFEDPYKSSKCESYLQSVNNPSISQIQFNNLSCVHRHYPVNENSLVERSPSFQHHSYATFYQNYNVAANFPAIPHASIRNAHQRFTGSSSFQGQSTTFQNPHYNNCVSNTTSEHSTPYFRNSNKVSLTSMDCLSQTINCTKRPPYVKTCPSLVNSSSYLLQTNNPSFSSSVSTVHPHSQRRNVLPFSPNKHGYVQYPMTSKVFHPTKGPKQLYCDICDKDFYSKERYDTHIENDHFPCGFPGCNYSAPLAVLNVHKLKHIKGENKNNILDDPLEIKKWIDARQRNFPKKTNEKIKDNTSPCAIERILRQQYMQEKSYGKHLHTKCAIVPELSSLLKRTKRWRYPDLFKKLPTRPFQNRRHQSFEFSYKDLITDFPICEHFLKFKCCKWSPCNFSHDIASYRRWKIQRNARGLDIAMRPPLLYQLLLSELKENENSQSWIKSKSSSFSKNSSTFSENSFSSSQNSSDVLSVEYIEDGDFYEEL